MAKIPQGVRTVFQKWATEFSESAWPRFRVLMLEAIDCTVPHAICRLLRIAGL